MLVAIILSVYFSNILYKTISKGKLLFCVFYEEEFKGNIKFWLILQKCLLSTLIEFVCWILSDICILNKALISLKLAKSSFTGLMECKKSIK